MLSHTYVRSILLAFCALALSHLFSTRFIIISKMLAGVATIKENKKHDVYLSLSYVGFNNLTQWQDNGLTCPKNLPSHTEAYIKTWLANFVDQKQKWVGNRAASSCS